MERGESVGLAENNLCYDEQLQKHVLICMCLAVQLKLTTDDWDECQGWLTALKRLLKLRGTFP